MPAAEFSSLNWIETDGWPANDDPPEWPDNDPDFQRWYAEHVHPDSVRFDKEQRNALCDALLNLMKQAGQQVKRSVETHQTGTRKCHGFIDKGVLLSVARAAVRDVLVYKAVMSLCENRGFDYSKEIPEEDLLWILEEGRRIAKRHGGR